MSDDRAGPEPGRAFRIASWNVLYDTGPGDRIVDFLDAVDADVAALQELSERHLDHVESLGRWHVIRSPDQTGAGIASFLGVISKRPSQSRRVVDIPAEIRPKPPLFSRLRATTVTQTALPAGLEINGRMLEVLNLHLTCATSPGGRRCERAFPLAALPADAPAVMLGDFNAMARRWINPAFAIPFGFRPADLLLNELAEVTAWAADHGFAGVADGVTFPWLGLQLDQIFVRGVSVVSAQILKQRFGSDHRPVVADLAL